MFKIDYQENGKSTGTLSLSKTAWTGKVSARPAIVSILPAFSKDRQSVESFITNTYAQAYNAKIGVHYPTLMSVRNENGDILSAAGFRYAATDPLFLEQYLETPIESVLNVNRHAVTEIGNLASGGGGASLFLFAALAAYLDGRNQSHAVITGTSSIEKHLKAFGLKPSRLAPADPSLLLQKDEDWGTYYDTEPHVLAGQVAAGYKRLQSALGANYKQNTARLYPRLHYREDR